MSDAACPWGFTRETLSAWRDGVLTAQRGQEIQAHLGGCQQCQQSLRAMTTLGRLMTQEGELIPGPEIWQGVYRRIQTHYQGSHIMRSRAIWGGVAGLLIAGMLTALFAAVLLTQRVGGSSSTFVPTATTNPINATASPRPSATAVPTATHHPTPPPAACVAYTGGAANSSYFAQVPLPAGTKSGAQSFGASDGVISSYSFDKLMLCSPGLAASDVRAYFATHMVQNGWQQSSTFPDDPGGNCADSYCWQRNAGGGITRFIGLQMVTDIAGGATYTLDSLNLIVH